VPPHTAFRRNQERDHRPRLYENDQVISARVLTSFFAAATILAASTFI
jgi:hypothetical protein